MLNMNIRLYAGLKVEASYVEILSILFLDLKQF